MRGDIFLFHWNDDEARAYAHPLQAAGWRVVWETADAGRGAALVAAKPPDLVVIYLRRLPSHSREVARTLREQKATKHIPVVFVDGDAEAIAKVRAVAPDAAFITNGELVSFAETFTHKKTT